MRFLGRSFFTAAALCATSLTVVAQPGPRGPERGQDRPTPGAPDMMRRAEMIEGRLKELQKQVEELQKMKVDMAKAKPDAPKPEPKGEARKPNPEPKGEARKPEGKGPFGNMPSKIRIEIEGFGTPEQKMKAFGPDGKELQGFGGMPGMMMGRGPGGFGGMPGGFGGMPGGMPSWGQRPEMKKPEADKKPEAKKDGEQRGENRGQFGPQGGRGEMGRGGPGGFGRGPGGPGGFGPGGPRGPGRGDEKKGDEKKGDEKKSDKMKSDKMKKDEDKKPEVKVTAATLTLKAAPSGIQPLARATYKLAPEKAQQLMKFIDSNKPAVFESKVEGGAVTITTTPEVQQAIATFVGLMQSK